MQLSRIKKKRSKKILRIGIIVILFLISVSALAYPYISNFMFDHRVDGVVKTMEQELDTQGKAERKKMREAAEQYNNTLFTGHVELKDPFEAVEGEDPTEAKNEYLSLLSTNSEGVMGLIQIPSIDVELPIYHTTAAEILEKGVGHLEGTSLPVGGVNTHCVLTGHTGLSNARMFTDISELKEGDYFFLFVLGEKMAYQVNQIEIKLPNEINGLYIKNNEDLCTLVTCYPYGVNSHRLMVTGKRVDYEEAASDPSAFAKKEIQSNWMKEYRKAMTISLSILAALLILVFLSERLNNKHKTKKNHNAADHDSKKGVE